MANYRTNPFSNIPLVVKNLLILNALMLFITWVIQSTYGYDLTRLLGLYYPGSEYFRKFQFITHMFMHGSFWHLFLNMFALWMFGTIIENVWGPKRFFIYYMVVGVGAAAFYVAVNAIQFSMISNAANEILNTGSPDAFMSLLKTHFSDEYKQLLNSDYINAWYNDPHNLKYAKDAYDFVHQRLTLMQNIPMVGASGAVFGVLLAFGMMFPNQPIYIYFLIPLKAKYLVIIYGLFELYAAVTEPGSQVAHVAHIGGMIFGFILIKYWNRKKSNFY
jgi:membrane associated rhomboid family serine protease